MHISLKAEEVVHIFGFSLTNSILTTWLVMFLLVLIGFLLTRKLTLVPGLGQSLIEVVIEGLFNLFKGINGEKVKTFFPLLATLFIFIISANWIGLLPGVGSIGIVEHGHGEEKLVPLFRGATADLNTTLALAIVAILSIQYYGIKQLGFSLHISKYINFKNPIYFFIGLLEIISEFSRIMSFAFRLFGNIFAGEVLLTVIAFLIPLFAPLPFLALEIFVGFIQALVFAMLTSVFLNVATAHEKH